MLKIVEAKHSKAVLEFIYLAKAKEFCKHDYSMSNYVFHFSVSIIEIEFQSIGFLACHFFHHFYPEIDSNAHFDSDFSNTGRFNRKTINTVRFSIIKIRISINIMYLCLKIIAEICKKVGSLDRKTKQNASLFPLCHCIYGVLLKLLYLLKMINAYRIFSVREK